MTTALTTVGRRPQRTNQNDTEIALERLDTEAEPHLPVPEQNAPPTATPAPIPARRAP